MKIQIQSIIKNDVSKFNSNCQIWLPCSFLGSNLSIIISFSCGKDCGWPVLLLFEAASRFSSVPCFVISLLPHSVRSLGNILGLLLGFTRDPAILRSWQLGWSILPSPCRYIWCSRMLLARLMCLHMRIGWNLQWSKSTRTIHKH